MAAGAALRLVSRRVPYLGWALTAWDLWNLYQRNGKQPFARYGGPDARWQKILDCGGGGIGPWASPFWAMSCGLAFQSDATHQGGFNPGYARGVYSGQSGWFAGYWKSAQKNFFGNWEVEAGADYFLRDRVNNVADPQPHPHPQSRGNTLPVGDPFAQRLPAVDPMLLMPQSFAPDPAPIPWKAIPEVPTLPPSERGHDSRPRPRYRHRRTPPRRNERERKTKVRSAAALALKGVHHLGEALDLLDALWNALPKEIRAKYGKNPSPQERGEALWDHWDELDMSDLMFELLWNHYGDKVWGRAFAGADQFGNREGVKWGPHGQGDAGAGIGATKKLLKEWWNNGIDVFTPGANQ